MRTPFFILTTKSCEFENVAASLASLHLSGVGGGVNRKDAGLSIDEPLCCPGIIPFKLNFDGNEKSQVFRRTSPRLKQT